MNPQAPAKPQLNSHTGGSPVPTFVEVLTVVSHLQAADLRHCHTLALASSVRAARPSGNRPWTASRASNASYTPPVSAARHPLEGSRRPRRSPRLRNASYPALTARTAAVLGDPPCWLQGEGCISHPGGHLCWLAPVDYPWMAPRHGTDRQRLDWDASNGVDDRAACRCLPLASGR